MSEGQEKPSKPSTSRTGGIRTLSDLNQPSGDDSHSNAAREYDTGGENSGMLDQGQPKGNDVDAIFEQPRHLGPMEVSLDILQPSSSSRSFSGTGRLLSGETVPTSLQQPELVVHKIVFWNNGFIVNDGPLRRLDDPENAPFLESLRISECPRELEPPADRRSTVYVKVHLIRKGENFPEPEIRLVPFQGVGRTLGSGSDPEETSAAPVLSAPTPSMGLVVDRSQPSTSIQLRFSDGTRMVAHFNYHHTIADIRSFIDASRPGGSRTYQLQTVGFPPKILNDHTQTIEHAGLLNSVIVQKN